MPVLHPALKAMMVIIVRLTWHDVFRVSIASSKHEGELGEFKTVMQTRDAVQGLHNCREFSQSPSQHPPSYACLDEAMETRKKVLYCFIKYFSKIIGQMKENAGFFFTSLLKQIFLIRAHISYQPIKTRRVTAVFPYSHLKTAIDQ